jgi:hypothetical protein
MGLNKDESGVWGVTVNESYSMIWGLPDSLYQLQSNLVYIQIE